MFSYEPVPISIFKLARCCDADDCVENYFTSDTTSIIFRRRIGDLVRTREFVLSKRFEVRSNDPYINAKRHREIRNGGRQKKGGKEWERSRVGKTKRFVSACFSIFRHRLSKERYRRFVRFESRSKPKRGQAPLESRFANSTSSQFFVGFMLHHTALHFYPFPHPLSILCAPLSANMSW